MSASPQSVAADAAVRSGGEPPSNEQSRRAFG